MESFDLIKMANVQTEKTNARMRYHRLQRITIFFRLVEVFLALIFLSWSSTKLPTLLRIASKYFTYFCHVMVSPHMVFLMGNAIIITLFAKSGQFSCHNVTGSSSGTGIYDEFVQNSNINKDQIDFYSPAPPVKDVVVYRDKQIARSQSEKFNKFQISEKPKRKLVRSKTETRPEKNKSFSGNEEMSKDEFRNKIESFIEKQLKFRRQESLAIVLQN